MTGGCGKMKVLTKANAAFLFNGRETTPSHNRIVLCAPRPFCKAACFGQQWNRKTGALRLTGGSYD